MFEYYYRIAKYFSLFGLLLFLTAAGWVAYVISSSGLEKERIVGPPPEEIQEICKPITDWIVSEKERTGSYPEALRESDLQILAKLPYDTSGSRPTYLRVGVIYEWPPPLYEFYWKPEKGWQ